jgi:hypothetical protein
MESIEARLAEIEVREKAATPGPWVVCEYAGYFDVQLAEDYEFANIWSDEKTPLAQANADFSANARTDVPWLIARLREALAFMRRGGDEPGCTERSTCGWPQAEGPYRRTCGKHMP